MLDIDNVPTFTVPFALSGLDQDAIFLISYISQETCPLPNDYMVISYRVNYIPLPSFLAGSEVMRQFFWLSGRKRNSLLSMIVPKEMYTIDQLETKCRTHFLAYLRGEGRTVDYRKNYSDVFSQWIRGKIILVFPEQEVSIYPKLRGIRMAQNFLYNLDTKQYDEVESYVRYIKETIRGFEYGTFPLAFTISDDYLTQALDEITVPNTVRSTKPYKVTLNPNERIRP